MESGISPVRPIGPGDLLHRSEAATRGNALALATPRWWLGQTSTSMSTGPGQVSTSDEHGLSGLQEQLALIEPQNLKRLEQPLRLAFADRSTARKGLEVAAGVAIADRLGAIRQTQGPAIGQTGYMLIVWLGSRWLQMEAPANTAVPFNQYRLLRDFAWQDAGKPARQALRRTLLSLQEARWEGEVNDAVTGRKTHEDHFGIIDRVLWPVTANGRLERPGYIFLGSWFLEQLRNEAGEWLDWAIVRDLPPIARKFYGLLENDRFAQREGEHEWQSYTLAPPLYASLGSSCARDRDNVAAVMRACDAIASLDPRYGFSRERVLDARSGWLNQVVVRRVPRPRGARGPARHPALTG